MKAVLVIDKMPTVCGECPLYEPHGCELGGCNVFNYYTLDDTKPDWCPLKPMPEHKKPQDPDETWEEMHVRMGYNKCLEDITDE